MNCAKCGLNLPNGVKQCPKCGMINEFAPPAPQKKIKPIVYVVAALAVIAIASIIVAAVMASRARQNVTSAPTGLPSPGNVTAAPPGQPGNGNIVSAPPGTPQTGDKAPAGVTKPKPPQEVLDYLEFVKKVEEHRQVLLKDTADALMLSSSAGQAQSLISMIDMASDPEGKDFKDPLADSKKELGRQYKNWVSTLEYFDTKAAPDQCRQFSGAYRAVLYNEAKAIGDVAVPFSKVDITSSQDMSKLLSTLQKLKRDPSLQTNIDQSADAADKKLTALVSQYDMQKPFSVPREQQTSGNIMGF